MVSPATVALEVGDTLRLTAEAQDDNGNPMDATAFVWMSDNVHVATVDSLGLVRARIRGDATMSAALGAANGSVNLTVTLPSIPPNSARGRRNVAHPPVRGPVRQPRWHCGSSPILDPGARRR